MDNIELLFFDTFSHDISEELNLDLVQFPKPVYISEVRIIPLGARVQADFPGGVRLGATNPSQFEIEFFVNDLSKPGASTFESLGELEYKQNIHIQLECERKQIPTDGLVLRGWYTTITLAVYGTLTKSLNNPQEVISSAAGSAVCTSGLEEVVENTTQISEQQSEWYYENQGQTNSSETCIAATPPPPIQPIQTVESTRNSISDTGKTDVVHWEEDGTNGTLKPVKRPSSPPSESLVSLSPESISAEEEEGEQDGGEPETGEPFEPILSDEDIMADDIPSTTEYECENVQLDDIYSLTPPDLLELEKSVNIVEEYTINNEMLDKIHEILQSLSKSVLHFNNASGQEKETFVHNCESLCAILSPFYLNSTDFNDLTNIVNAGLDMDLARAQPQPAYKVRHVKVGVRLAEALCKLSQGPDILLKVDAPYKLLALCMRENVALPVKLSALRTLDAALISPVIVQEFLKSKSNLYKNALMMLDTAKLARLKYALSSLLRKVHTYEFLDEMTDLNEFAMTELMNTYVYAPTLMAQPKRQLPAGAQMEFEREQNRNPRCHLIAYFDHHKLLYHILVALTSPKSDLNLIKASRRFLLRISDTKEGLLYLLKDPGVTKLILKALKCELPGIGSVLAWRLQVVQCLLRLKYQPSDWLALKKLHSFLIFPEGLQAIITVLPTGEFIDILIPYLSDANLCEFSAEIISTIIRYSDRIEVFQNRATIILEKSRAQAVLKDVTSYMTTAAQATHWNYGDVSQLVACIRKSADKAAFLPGQLITACRILYYLVFPSNNDVDPMEPYIELKYRNALTQLFAADGLTALIAVMASISEFYEQPFLHRAALTGRRGLALVALLLPCVRLTRALLERLVKCMATDFKDLTAVVPLLGVYSLVEAIPPVRIVQTLSEEIVGTLLVFTQAVDSDGSGNVAKSLWTQMLGEVLKMVSLSPCNFIPGLKLLTRLLPPVLTLKETITEDAARILGFRKLWSAHLQAQANNLIETLRLLCASWNKDLLVLLSKVCKQLSDLAAPTALLVGRCLLDGIIAATSLENNVLILALLSELARHAPMKATLLTLTSPASRAQVKSDQKYPPVIEMMCTVLKNTNNIRIQYELLDIFETLCDCTLSLMQEDTNEPFEKRLTHSVPSKEPLLSILAALIDILATSTKFEPEILQSTLRILLSLSSHNYGLYHVKSCLENNPDALRSLLEHISVLEDPEAQAVVNLTIMFLENLIASESQGRSLYLRVQQLASLISWDKNDHPLEKIKSAQELVEIFKSAEDKEEKEPIPEMLEPLLPTPEALLNQFSQRCLGTPDFILKRSKKVAFMSPSQAPNENTVDLLALAAELLPTDFNLLIEAQSLCSKAPPDDATQPLQSKTQTDDQETRDIQKQSTSPVSKVKQPFVTPMRGRTQFTNSLRGGPVVGGVGRGADPFRSRPPNTSRPPSLHVDDFVALETCGAQPTGPTGYNKLSIRGTCPSRAINAGTRSRPWAQETRPPYLR
ncbi:protein virilizer [Colletes gigas]|uniref:protein virilizer n=1 Tax=Colletes gigas TaxID=935657 RepID=UPI001C9B3CCE|nr:protein virilizer [Colletes gigas]XP_043260018.1 protein virilizer [Colletes gigas]XP_043260026.1 protein virilizer [Colletes gigas]XP_043260035.1 protein virilizer [Colletes gigas]XP_043260043.1 protein virilizer [Colletes gigas]